MPGALQSGHPVKLQGYLNIVILESNILVVLERTESACEGLVKSWVDAEHIPCFVRSSQFALVAERVWHSNYQEWSACDHAAWSRKISRHIVVSHRVVESGEGKPEDLGVGFPSHDTYIPIALATLVLFIDVFRIVSEIRIGSIIKNNKK